MAEAVLVLQLHSQKLARCTHTLFLHFSHQNGIRIVPFRCMVYYIITKTLEFQMLWITLHFIKNSLMPRYGKQPTNRMWESWSHSQPIGYEKVLSDGDRLAKADPISGGLEPQCVCDQNTRGHIGTEGKSRPEALGLCIQPEWISAPEDNQGIDQASRNKWNIMKKNILFFLVLFPNDLFSHIIQLPVCQPLRLNLR